MSSLWSLVLPGGGEETVVMEQTFEEETFLRLRNIALASSLHEGLNTVSVVVNGEECVLCTLAKGGQVQHDIETLLDCTATFRNSGTAPVHLLGEFTTINLDDLSQDMSEISDLDGSDSESSDGEAPMAVPLSKVPPISPELLRLNKKLFIQQGVSQLIPPDQHSWTKINAA